MFPSSGFFLAQITGILPNNQYTWVEVWRSGGAWQTKQAGRYGSANNPGNAIPGVTFNVTDYAICRSADGEAGLQWELFPPGGIPNLSINFTTLINLPTNNQWVTISQGPLDLSPGSYLLYASITVAGIASNLGINPFGGVGDMARILCQFAAGGVGIGASMAIALCPPVANALQTNTCTIIFPYTAPQSSPFTLITLQANRTANNGADWVNAWAWDAPGGTVGSPIFGYIKIG